MARHATAAPARRAGLTGVDEEEFYDLANLAAELAKTGQTELLRALLLDLDWMRAKVQEMGYAALDEDLALLDSDAGVRSVRQALRHSADVLEPLSPDNALMATLLSCLPPGGARAAVIAATAPGSLLPRLDSVWSAGGTGPVAQAIAGDDAVTVLLSFPDGRRLLRGDDRGAVGIFDVELGELVASLTGHTSQITAASVSPDGRQVATADARGWLRLWSLDAERGLPSDSVEIGVHDGVAQVAFVASGRSLATVNHSGAPAIWDRTLRSARHLDPAPGAGPNTTVGPLYVASDDSWLAAQIRGDGYGAHVWDTATGRLLQTRADIGMLAAGPDGGLIAAHGDDVVVWDPPAGRIAGTIGPGWLARGLVERMRWHVSRNRSMWISHTAVDPGGSWLARIDQLEKTRGEAVSQGATLRVRDRAANVDHQLRLPGTVGATVTGPDGAWLAVGTDSGYSDGAIHLWQPGREPRLLGEHAAAVSIGAASARGDWLATADRHGTTRLWATGDPAAAGRPPELARSMTVCRSARHADWFVTVDSDRMAYVVDAVTGRVRHELTGRERITFLNGLVYTGVVAVDGSWLATADDDGTVSFWDPVTGHRRALAEGHTGQVVASDASAQWLATVDRDGGVLIWSPFSSRPRCRFDVGPGFRRFCRADPAGRWLAVGGEGNDDVHLLFPAAPDAPRVARLPGQVTALDVRGSQLLVGQADGGVHLIDVPDPRPVPIHQAPAPVRHLVTSPDRSWTALVVQPDGDPAAQIRVIRPDGPAPVVVIDRFVEPVTACRPSPDGRLLATVSDQRTLRIWNPADGRAVTGIRVDGGLTDVTWLGPSGPICAVGRRGVELFDLRT